MATKNENQVEDFDIISENWSSYELEDKTIIRLKNVLMAIERDTSELPKKLGLSFGMKLLISIHSPSNLRGQKGRNWSLKELEKYIVQPNLMYRILKDGGSALYETKTEKISVRTRIIQIDKTSKHQFDGQPAYIIRTESDIAIDETGVDKTGILPVAIEKSNVNANP